MLRESLIGLLCLMLSVSSAPAAEPLTPGKPAGVRAAQSGHYYGAIAVGALALIAIAGYAISSSPYHIPGTPNATAATSTQP
jgi:hypothetical protein